MGRTMALATMVMFGVVMQWNSEWGVRAERGRERRPWEQKDADDIQDEIRDAEKKRGYDPQDYGGYESPKLYYEKMLTLNAEGGNIKKVKLYLDAGIDINAQEEEGETALMKAARAGRRKTVKLLIKRGADVNLRNDLGETALMLSSAAGHKSVSKSILSHEDVEVDALDINGETALFKAAYNANKRSGSIARALLQAGADPNVETSNGWTPLHAAVKSSQANVVEELIDNDVELNFPLKEQHNRTAIMISIEGHRTKITHLLLFESTDALDVNTPDDHGVTPLMYAAVKGNSTVVKEMIRQGANVNAFTYRDRDTALHRACFFGHVDTVRALLKRGARVTAQNEVLQTPLMKASWYDHEDIVKVLLAYGAGSAMDHKSVHGDTALSKAKEWGREKIVKLLEEEQAKRSRNTDHFEL